MRTAKTILTVIQERGKQHKPIERVYKLLFNREFYLNAYAKLYPNNGALTKGVTEETVDGMSIQKIDRMIELLREEKYQWKPARREYIPKKNGKKRPLGIPTWGDKLLQEVMREILEAYYEPQFSTYSHGFRPNRGCHTALQEIQVWKGTRWFIEGIFLNKRLTADTCELCGSSKDIEVHHIRKLADLKTKGKSAPPVWVQIMAARQRKTLVVCRECHTAIHNGTLNIRS